MGARDFGATFLVVAFPLSPPSPYHKPRLKKLLKQSVEGGRELSNFILGRKSIAYMEPKRETGPIPTGWTLKTEVQKNGSETPLYYCPETRQHFYTYSNLMRYVKYAQKKGLGIYALSGKPLKRKKNEDDSNAAETRKTSPVLSVPGKPPSNSNSLTVDKKNDSKSGASSESTDKGKDEDYVPEADAVVTAESDANTEKELNQMKEEMNDLVADNNAGR